MSCNETPVDRTWAPLPRGKSGSWLSTNGFYDHKPVPFSSDYSLLALLASSLVGKVARGAARDLRQRLARQDQMGRL